MSQEFKSLKEELLVVAKDMLHKVKSRKFQVWVIATIAFFMLILPPDGWMMISMLYIGVQGALDFKGLANGKPQKPTAPDDDERGSEV